MTDGATPANRLGVARWEADRHLSALESALGDWAASGARVDAAVEDDPVLRRLTDQILYRFMKLQDAMGERLVPATLSLLAEPHEGWPMRDKIDRLERLAFVDAQQWLAWRDLRNRLSHEYPDRPDLRWAAVEAAIQASAQLASCYRAWRAQLDSRSLL
ncbi:MAG: hypothetical protein ACOYLV_16690 [Rubrivivax sp.]|jgi:hypothetical protein